MQVQTITMSRDEARRKLNAYLADKHADTREQYQDCAKGYEALAAGYKLLHLDEAIRNGGVFDSGMPRLAVARADRKLVGFHWERAEELARFDSRDTKRQYSVGNPGSLIRRIEMRRRPPTWLTGYAEVPLVPADVRPAKGLLKDWFILWEVQRWFDSPRRTEPDRDPLLLKHLAGKLYAVLAEWDLTDLERAVLAGALRPEGEL